MKNSELDRLDSLFEEISESVGVKLSLPDLLDVFESPILDLLDVFTSPIPESPPVPVRGKTLNYDWRALYQKLDPTSADLAFALEVADLLKRYYLDLIRFPSFSMDWDYFILKIVSEIHMFPVVGGVMGRSDELYIQATAVIARYWQDEWGLWQDHTVGADYAVGVFRTKVTDLGSLKDANGRVKVDVDDVSFCDELNKITLKYAGRKISDYERVDTWCELGHFQLGDPL